MVMGYEVKTAFCFLGMKSERWGYKWQLNHLPNWVVDASVIGGKGD
jgi:hypothetical protein